MFAYAALGTLAVREGLCRMHLSPEFLKADGWRAPGFSSVDDFLLSFRYASFLPIDPNNVLCVARRLRDVDVSRHTNGDLSAALGRITAKMVKASLRGKTM